MNSPHFSPPERPRRRALSGGSTGDIPLSWGQLLTAAAMWLAWMLACALAMLAMGPARAQTMAWAPDHAAALPTPPSSGAADANAPWQAELQQLLQGSVQQVAAEVPDGSGKAPRIEIELGRLDPRLKLAPCEKVQAYMPEGARLWGRSRVGLRCEQGAVRWNVYWPVTVRVWGTGLMAVVPLRPGVPVAAADLRVGEIELTESVSPPLRRLEDVVGRSVLRTIEPGQSVRQDDVRARRWFAAGDPVRVMVRGSGFAVASEGVALSHGDEGRCSRVRVDSGRVLCAHPVGLRQVEVTL